MYYKFYNSSLINIKFRRKKNIYWYVDTAFEIINMNKLNSPKFYYVHENGSFELVSVDKTVLYHEVHLFGVVGDAPEFITHLHVFSCSVSCHKNRLIWSLHLQKKKFRRNLIRTLIAQLFKYHS